MFNQDSVPIKNTGRESGYRSTSDVGMRPVNDPKSQKDFRRILGRDSKDEEKQNEDLQNVGEEGATAAAAAETEQAHLTPVSPFGLAGKKSADTKFAGKLPANQPASSQETESPSQLFARMTTAPKEAKEASFKSVAISAEDEPVVDTTPKVPTLPTEKPHRDSSSDLGSSFGSSSHAAAASLEQEGKKDKFTTRFSTEQSDLSYVNLLAVNPQPVAAVDVKSDKLIMPVKDVQEIINQLVESIYSIRESGKTDMAITLKHPPLLEGAQLIVTSFDSAKGEFNISFENLTQAAKNVLDLRANQDSLLHALEQKGYAVHIITTTTLVENRPVIAADSSQNQQQQERGEREGQGRGGRQQQGRDERETG